MFGHLRAFLGFYCLVVVTWVTFSALPVRADDPFQEARLAMVREEVTGAGITDERVIAAMRDTPRHLFVPATQRKYAYFDLALPIGGGQTISPPFVVAFMTEALHPQPTDKVLEIGTGSGYQAAVLSPLVAEVYSIEIVESLGQTAARTLQRGNYKNVFTRIGDGFQGWAEHAPFDKIIVTCSPQKIPTPLVEQLREGGRMVIPLGERYQQTLYLFTKRNGMLAAEALESTFFVPMTGRAETLRVSSEEQGIPQLVNGSFETALDEAAAPKPGEPPSDPLPGWYYVRQATIVPDDKAPDGRHVLTMRNETPGRGAQALQALGMDGRQVSEIAITASIATRDVRPGQSPQQLPRIELSFFDEARAPIGRQTIGPWYGTTDWTAKSIRVRVPPKSRLAVLAVGMFGGVGEFSVDNVRVQSAP